MKYKIEIETDAESAGTLVTAAIMNLAESLVWGSLGGGAEVDVTLEGDDIEPMHIRNEASAEEWDL